MSSSPELTLSSALFALALFVILILTLFCVTDWLAREVLELKSKRPLRSAAATLALSAITIGPAIHGFDIMLSGSLDDVSRMGLWGLVGALQTGLVLKLTYRSQMPLAMVHGFIFQLSWGAVSVLMMICHRLGGFYSAAPLVLMLTVYITRRVQDRELKRRLDSVPPTPMPRMDTGVSQIPPIPPLPPVTRLGADRRWT